MQLPDQMKLVGELVQVAVSVTMSPVSGAVLSDASVQVGTGPVGGGLPLPVHVTGMATCVPVPLALMPDTAKVSVVAMSDV